MERRPYHLDDLFIGDRKLFREVLQDRKTLFVFDVDGILANTPKIVLKRFSERHGINVKPSEISDWSFLTNTLRENGFSKEDIKNAENDWYEADVLSAAQKYLYVKPIIHRTIGYYGIDNNFVLTSRNPSLQTSTFDWITRELPEIRQENVLMRKNGGVMNMKDSATYKVDQLKSLSMKAPWVVFVDDSVDFVEAVAKADIPNCMVINIPLGKIMPDFYHERMVVIKRYPNELQAMYPLMDAIDRVIDNNGNVAQSY